MSEKYATMLDAINSKHELDHKTMEQSLGDCIEGYFKTTTKSMNQELTIAELVRRREDIAKESLSNAEAIIRGILSIGRGQKPGFCPGCGEFGVRTSHTIFCMNPSCSVETFTDL